MPMLCAMSEDYHDFFRFGNFCKVKIVGGLVFCCRGVARNLSAGYSAKPQEDSEFYLTRIHQQLSCQVPSPRASPKTPLNHFSTCSMWAIWFFGF